jgi:hypothetical protein
MQEKKDYADGDQRNYERTAYMGIVEESDKDDSKNAEQDQSQCGRNGSRRWPELAITINDRGRTATDADRR